MNVNFEGLEGFGEGAFGSFLATFGVLAIFVAIIISILIIGLWIFGSIGLMNLAKKNNISNAWLVFLPVGRSYIIGKLGFEAYGDKNNKNNSTFMWVTFGLGVASFLLGGSNGDLSTLIKYGLLFFECWAFYNMFKNLNEKNTIVYTVFTALTGTLLGGIFLYLMKEPIEVKEVEPVEEKKEEPKKKEKKETKKKESKKDDSKFCSQCGNKLLNDSKFCPECGNKVK